MLTKTSGKTWIGLWIFACVITQLLQILGDGLSSWMGSIVGSSPNPGDLSILLQIAVFRLLSSGLGGFIQGKVLGSRLPFLRNWVIATSLGSSIAFLLVNGLYVATLISSTGNSFLDMMLLPRSSLPSFIFAGLTGLILGMVQWLALWRGNVPQAHWWILLSMAGLLTSDLVVGWLQRMLGEMGLDSSTGAGSPIFWLISCLGIGLYALITSSFWVKQGEQQ